ncbi:MAG: zf-TFIIB domain-containing protein [Elusimicrobiota bacterium]
MAHCPKCKFIDINEIDSGLGCMIDECPECGGRWFDLGELEKIAEHPEKLREAIESGPIKPRESERECPRCENKLVNAGLINQFLRADFCAQCSGIWLDKHELTLVDKLLAA